MPNVNYDFIANAVEKFKNHPSILLIKSKVSVDNMFSFAPITIDVMEREIKRLNTHKPTTFNNIPAKLLVNNFDIYAHQLYVTFSTILLKMLFFPTH